MEIAFRFVTGKVQKLILEPFQTVIEAKTKLSALTQNRQESIHLFYGRRELQNERRLSECDIHQNDVINVVIMPMRRPSHSPAAQKAPEQSNELQGLLPPRRSACEHSHSDPPNFDKSVETLQSLGFDKELCEKALRASFYSPDRAAEYLISGSLPEEVTSDIKILQEKREELCKECSTKSINQFTNHIIPQLTSEEKESLMRLQELGYPKETVIQCFFACDKDMEKTAFCLSNLK